MGGVTYDGVLMGSSMFEVLGVCGSLPLCILPTQTNVAAGGSFDEENEHVYSVNNRVL
jgi:hypothetical protein